MSRPCQHVDVRFRFQSKVDYSCSIAAWAMGMAELRIPLPTVRSMSIDTRARTSRHTAYWPPVAHGHASRALCQHFWLRTRMGLRGGKAYTTANSVQHYLVPTGRTALYIIDIDQDVSKGCDSKKHLFRTAATAKTRLV